MSILIERTDWTDEAMIRYWLTVAPELTTKEAEEVASVWGYGPIELEYDWWGM